MSRPTLTRSDRVAQMTKQEELIAKKRQEILEKQRTCELAKAVAAAQNSVSGSDPAIEIKSILSSEMKPKAQNNFCNDGSFLTHFQKILESVKKQNEKEEIPEISEAEETIKDVAQIRDELVPELSEKETNFEIDSMRPTPPPISNPPNHSLNAPPPTTQNTVPGTNIRPPPPAIFYPPNQIQITSNNNSSFPTQPPPLVPFSGIPPTQGTNFSHAPYFNPNIPPPILNTKTPPPPPPPLPTLPVFLIAPPEPLQLNNIPPPEPIQLSTIPPPKELDLNAIPKPEMNLDAIKIPEQETVFSDNNEQFLPTTLESLIELVAENGDAYEENIRTRKNDVHPSLWFLYDKESDDYINFRKQVLLCRENAGKYESDEKYDPESVCQYHEDSDDEYMKFMMDRNFDNLKRKLDHKEEEEDGEHSDDDRESGKSANRQRKRKSRWGGKIEGIATSGPPSTQTHFANQNKPLLAAIQRTDPALLQYARQNYGTTNLSEEDWLKCEEHFKVNLLYQDMMRKRQEIDRLAKSGKFKYEYDSDEDITGGTWEHKLRTAEMEATQAWADALTEQSQGKHHIGDFLPPEELKKFMEKYDAKKNNRQPDLSDYKEYKLKEDNIGFQMLQKLGWKEGQGLGASGEGIVDPVNKAPQRDANQGLGAGTSSNPDDCENEYEAYRKRMMLAYRFRPNPLNNPRRAYY